MSKMIVSDEGTAIGTNYADGSASFMLMTPDGKANGIHYGAAVGQPANTFTVVRDGVTTTITDPKMLAEVKEIVMGVLKDGKITGVEQAKLTYLMDDVADDKALNLSAPNKPDGFSRY